MFKVSRWMGHRSLAITDEVYAKLFKSDPDRESAALAAFLADQRKAAAVEAVLSTAARSATKNWLISGDHIPTLRARAVPAT